MRTLLFALAVTAVVDVKPPPTPKKPVVDTYFGEQVTDDYRWLEDWNDPAVKAWSDAQNARARKILDALPGRAAIEKRLTELLGFTSPSYRAVVPRGGRYFALKQQPPKQQPFVVVLDKLDDTKSERVVVDPNALDPSGSTSMDFFVPSPDGQLVAVSLSKGGSESGTVHVFDVKTGKERDPKDVVPRANSGTAGGTLAWAKDGHGFWYTRHPAPPEASADDDGFYQQVAFHALGTPAASDKVELGALTGGTRDDLVRTAENFLEASDDGRFVSDLVQKGDGGEFELWLRTTTKSSKWRKVASFEDRVVASRFAPDGSLVLLSRKDAPRGKVLRLPATAASMAQASVVLAEGPLSIETLEATRSRVFLVEQDGGPSRVEIVPLAGDAQPVDVAVTPVSSVACLMRTDNADEVVFESQSYTSPPAWFVSDGAGKVTPTALFEKAPASMSDVVVTRHEATSKDGTKVPYTLMAVATGKKGAPKPGDAPVWLTGYGGFDIPNAPRFNKASRAWLEQGGIIVVANLRGGSEFGEAWHQAGMKTKKQNVFDDFIAVAGALTSGPEKVTTPAHLAIQGGSNGGLLMGAALTQRPELFRAVVAQVGYFDMLRFETKPNGAFNNTEYGSVKNEDEYKALKAYSPYHHVKEGVKYPPTLFMTGANDPRVDPLHSRKMVARLQAVGAEALLRTSGGTGHGIGSPLKERIAEAVDMHAFLWHELGIAYKAP